MARLKTRILIRGGKVTGLYDDKIAPQRHEHLGGKADIRRASHVEAPAGQLDKIEFEVDLSPSAGPKLSGFPSYKSAVDAEIGWLHEHTLKA